jgi:hypothetical protein
MTELSDSSPWELLDDEASVLADKHNTNCDVAQMTTIPDAVRRVSEFTKKSSFKSVKSTVIDPSSESKIIKFQEIVKNLKLKLNDARPKLEVSNFVGAEKDYLLKQEVLDYILNQIVPCVSLSESQKDAVEEVLRQARLRLKVQYSGKSDTLAIYFSI